MSPVSISEETYIKACEDNMGWCTSCEDFTMAFAEPDVREYTCPECDENTVFGAEQALMEGLITIE